MCSMLGHLLCIMAKLQVNKGGPLIREFLFPQPCLTRVGTPFYKLLSFDVQGGEGDLKKIITKSKESDSNWVCSEAFPKRMTSNFSLS